jgi:hypothetical protein
MSSIRSGRLRRPAAERLLDGGAAGRAGGTGQRADPLASLLAAAAAPPRPGEQPGEDVAVTAFRAEHLVPASHSGRGQMIKSPLAKLLTMKAGALALALSAGGVAVAATTGAFSAPPAPAGHHVSIHAAGGGRGGGAHAAVRASGPGAHVSASGHAPTVGSVLSATGAAQACHELAGRVTAAVAHADGAAVTTLTETGLQGALQSPALSRVVSNPAFASLVATAEGRGNVADYCGLILDLGRLASPAALAGLPASVLSAIPAGIVGQLPASALGGAPVAVLSRLPVAFLSRLSGPALAALPASVLARLPASVLSRLPASLLKGLLPGLSGGTLGQLPSKLLAGAMSGLPAKSLIPVVTKLPTATRVKTLPLLPLSVLAALPKSLLSGLPGSLLGRLGSLL